MVVAGLESQNKPCVYFIHENLPRLHAKPEATGHLDLEHPANVTPGD
jgi:hypothetical protein